MKKLGFILIALLQALQLTCQLSPTHKLPYKIQP